MSRPSPEKPVLLVGLGIAGACLSWALRERGIEHRIYDDLGPGAASRIAAGIINPITGRNRIKAHRIDELLPLARKTYTEMGDFLGLELWKDREVLVLLTSAEERYNWQQRAESGDFSPYLVQPCTLEQEEQNKLKGLQPIDSVVRVRAAGQVMLTPLLQAYQEKLLGEGRLIQTSFDYRQLQIRDSEAHYDGQRWSRVIFCEGHRVRANPWFGHLPWRINRGQRWLLEIPALQQEAILRKKGLLAPMGGHQYWLGSSNDWGNAAAESTELAREALKSMADDMLKVDYGQAQQAAGIRPLLQDRRPVVGWHPDFPMLGIINGLGTKGGSLAPWLAVQMANALADQESFAAELAPERFR